MARDFLLEIGTEELPASACLSVLDLLPDRAAALFAANDIDLEPGSLDVMVGPRRIALLVRYVPDTQTPRETAQRGPGDRGRLRRRGSPHTGRCRASPRRKAWLPTTSRCARRVVGGSCTRCRAARGDPTAMLLPDICIEAGAGDVLPQEHALGGARPALLASRALAGGAVRRRRGAVRGGRRRRRAGTSRGHRWLGGPVALTTATGYVDAVRGARVMVDHREREAFLWAELRRCAAERGLDVVDPMAKMREVKFLVEWPTVLAGGFGEEHLRLPADVLVTAMQSHQRYFPLIDGEGRLSSTFLYVMNGDPAFAAQITAGNERVLDGRIEDAEFSFDKDLATGLEQMVTGLDRVVFHVKAGTMKDKTDRLVALTGLLADMVGASPEAGERALEAARLAKADQVSVMVREFADLEGVMGETYARMEGFHEEVAQAIREQFLPDAAGGDPPRSLPGALLATAEKVDNVVAAFACGEPPSGSRDPYGLRRAAMGMVTIAFVHGLSYDVRELVGAAYGRLERFPHLVHRETRGERGRRLHP